VSCCEFFFWLSVSPYLFVANLAPFYAFRFLKPVKPLSKKKIFPAKKEKQFIDDLKKEKSSDVKREEDGMWLTFLPVIDTDEFGDDVVDELKVHLHNRTKTVFNFDYKLSFIGKPEFELKNTIQPFS